MSAPVDSIVQWLRERLAQAASRGFVVGLSGGVDSAVVAGLCHAAAPGRVIGVLLPCHSDPRDEIDARLVAEHFGIPAIRVDLTTPFDGLTTSLREAVSTLPAGGFAESSRPPGAPASPDAAAGNVKSRLRMTALYSVANSLGCLVVGTGNRSELSVGYFTKYGDGAADLLPLGELLKSEVRAAAVALGVPAAVIDKAPSAGLLPGQTDEAELGFTYAELERYLTAGAGTVSPALAMRIERLMRTSEHKRSLPPTPGAP